MKKVIIIAMLLTVLSASILATGVCYAEETETYYYVDKGKELIVYASGVRGSGISMQIPQTYAFKYVKEEADKDFAEIEYNGHKGYILVNDLNAICKQVNSKWGDNAYAYDIPVSTLALTSPKVVLYNEKDMSILGNANGVSSDMIRIDTVYSYYFNQSNECYFLVGLTLLGFTEDSYVGFIKASDTSLSNFSKDTIPQSAGYTAQTAPDPTQPPSGEITSGDNDTNVDNTSPTQTPKNSLDRYILIAVIAVLCVVIMILIFLPNKKRQN